MSHQLQSLADKFYAFMEGRNAPRTISYYRTFIQRFIQSVGNLDVGELRKHHLLTWGRTWHAIQSVQRLFAWAHTDAELIERNPFKGIKRPRLGERRRVLTRREILLLLRGSDNRFRFVLLFLRESIARPQEVRAVRWEQLGWEGDHKDALAAIRAGQAYFELWEYKSRKQRKDNQAPRVIFVNARLGRLLLRMAAASGSMAGPVFLNSRGVAWSNNAIRLRMRRLRDRLKMSEDKRGEKLVCYTMRHTQATNACAAGMPDRVLAEIMGHTNTRTTARYQHLSRMHLRDAFDKFC